MSPPPPFLLLLLLLLLLPSLPRTLLVSIYFLPHQPPLPPPPPPLPPPPRAGLLASVQAYLLRHLIYVAGSARPHTCSRAVFEEALFNGIADILWQAGGEQRACVAVFTGGLQRPQKSPVTAKRALCWWRAAGVCGRVDRHEERRERERVSGRAREREREGERESVCESECVLAGKRQLTAADEDGLRHAQVWPRGGRGRGEGGGGRRRRGGGGEEEFIDTRGSEFRA